MRALSDWYLRYYRWWVSGRVQEPMVWRIVIVTCFFGLIWLLPQIPLPIAAVVLGVSALALWPVVLASGRQHEIWTERNQDDITPGTKMDKLISRGNWKPGPEPDDR